VAELNAVKRDVKKYSNADVLPIAHIAICTTPYYGCHNTTFSQRVDPNQIPPLLQPPVDLLGYIRDIVMA
jgi:hypothetical protein